MKSTSLLAFALLTVVPAHAWEDKPFSSQIEIYSSSSPTVKDEFDAKENAKNMAQNGNICLTMMAKKMAILEGSEEVAKLAEKIKDQYGATGVRLKWRLVPGWLMSQSYTAEVVMETYRQNAYKAQYGNGYNLGEYNVLQKDVLAKGSGSINDLRDKGSCDLDTDAVVAKLKSQVIDNPNGLTLSSCESSLRDEGRNNMFVRQEYEQMMDAGLVKGKLPGARGEGSGPTPFAKCMSARKSLIEENEKLFGEMQSAASGLGVNLKEKVGFPFIRAALSRANMDFVMVNEGNACLRLASAKLQEINASKEVQELLGKLKDQVGLGSGARDPRGKVELVVDRASDGTYTVSPRVGIFHTTKFNPAPFQVYDAESPGYLRAFSVASGKLNALLKGKKCVPSEEEVVKLLKSLITDRKASPEQIEACKKEVAGYARYLRRLEGSNTDLGSTAYALKQAIGERYLSVSQEFARDNYVSARECFDRLDEQRESAEKMKSVVRELAVKKNLPTEIFEPKADEVSAELKNGTAE